MKEKNRSGKGEKGKKPGKAVFAGGSKCVYCGKGFAEINPETLPKVTVLTKSFPVCGEDCRAKAEEYVVRDKKLKKYMYLMILAAAVCILISAITSNNALMGIGLVIACAAFIVFPYPISMFDTFQSSPIRTVTVICRVIGVVLAAFAVIMLLVV